MTEYRDQKGNMGRRVGIVRKKITSPLKSRVGSTDIVSREDFKFYGSKRSRKIEYSLE